jgi:L-asparagine transporter-like permease
MKHQLKSRHLQMLALGGVIGTGLFLGTSKSLISTGPSLLLSYILGGLVIFIIMRALGEMTVYNPDAGSFSLYAKQYCNKYMGFIAAVNAWFEYTVVCMVELSAVAFFIDYWHIGISHWLLCLIILITFAIINLLGVRLFGEFEFWLSLIKIIAIVLMLIISIYLILIKHIINPDIASYLNYSVAFNNGIFGFIVSSVIVIFSFGGTEFIGIAASETENPKKNIPKAINSIVFRIVFFYVLTICAILLLFPYNKLNVNSSPFVDVFNKIGMKNAALIMNFIAIIAALSAFNSCLYSSSRMLYAIGLNNNVNILKSTSKNGLPINAIIINTLIIFATVLINYFYPKQALIYLLGIATGSIIITWLIILITHIMFRLKLKNNLQFLAFKLPFFPYSNIFAILCLVVITIMMYWIKELRISLMIMPLWLIAISILYFFTKGHRS